MPKPQYYKACIVEGSRIFDNLAFFNNLYQHCSVHGPVAFCLYQNETATAGMKLATFGSAAKHCNHYTNEEDKPVQ